MTLLDQIEDQRHRLEHWLERAGAERRHDVERLGHDAGRFGHDAVRQARRTAHAFEHDTLDPAREAALVAAERLAQSAAQLAAIGLGQGRSTLAPVLTKTWRKTLRTTRRTGRAIQADPAPLVIGALAVLLTASLLARRDRG